MTKSQEKQNKPLKITVEKPKITPKSQEKPNPNIEHPKYMQIREAENRSKAQELIDLIDNINTNTKK